MYCTNCGSKIEEDKKFCTECGSSVSDAENMNDKVVIDIKNKENVFKWAGYIWTVIVNIITTCVVVAIYSDLYDNFEIIVVSLLMLIYLSIQTLAITYGNTIIANIFSTNAQFERVRKLLRKDNKYNEEEELEKEEIAEAKKEVAKKKVKMYINIGFAILIYIIVIFNLFGAI